MSTPHFVAVAKTLALVGAVAAGGTACTQFPVREANAQTPTPRPPPPPACPSSLPVSNSACAGYAPQQMCDFGYAQCTCTYAANSRTPTWNCLYRAVPGPLPPPELA